MNNTHAPDGFLHFSDTVHRLTQGMWGGLPRPVIVRPLKQDCPKGSVGFGLWREQAGKRLRDAAVSGELVVYVIAEHANIEPMAVPAEVLKQLITTRGGLPDHPVRPSLKTAGYDEKLFVWLNSGTLVVRKSDFEVWYRDERAKGRWPSQRSKKKTRVGRPTKRTEALSNAVLARIHDGEWDGKGSIAKLRRLLVVSGAPDIPSIDTLTRLVDQLFSETSEPGLLRIARVRRQRARAR
jgi:hypothetical protein